MCGPRLFRRQGHTRITPRHEKSTDTCPAAPCARNERKGTAAPAALHADGRSARRACRGCPAAADPRGEGGPVPCPEQVHHAGRRPAGHSRADDERRPARGPRRNRMEQLELCRLDQRLDHGLPGPDGPGRDVEPGDVRPLRKGRRRRGPLPGKGCPAGSGRQHLPHTAQRPQLRVHGRRPLPGRGDGRSLHPGASEKRRGGLCQALRTEQSGAVARIGRRRGQRTGPARDLPAGIPQGGGRRRLVDHHGLLQPLLGTALLPQRGAAERHPAQGVGIRRLRHHRLGRRPRHARGGPQRTGHRDGNLHERAHVGERLRI